MTVWVNGEERALRVETLAELVAALGLDPARPGVAAAVNDAIVPRCQWHGTALRAGDRVELVGAMAGG